jgi:hypothetical protein
MSFSLDTPSAASLKSEAKLLREARAIAGMPLTQSAALEEVARRHGYRDWNTAVAALPERFVTPVQVGQRVKGTYMSKPFIGLVIGMQLTPPHFQITVKFDQPVNVSKFESMVHNRQRVSTTIDIRGVSLSHTSDGEPHMRIQRL